MSPTGPTTGGARVAGPAGYVTRRGGAADEGRPHPPLAGADYPFNGYPFKGVMSA